MILMLKVWSLLIVALTVSRVICDSKGIKNLTFTLDDLQKHLAPAYLVTGTEEPLDGALGEYDVIVIGVGSSGAVVANRLSEVFDWSVLAIEAGGDETVESDIPMMASKLLSGPLDWTYLAEPTNNTCLAMENNQCVLHQGRVLGGSSAINYMSYSRGNRKDFDNWAASGNKAWNYDEVLPYFLKSEDMQNPYLARTSHHATGGYLTIQESPWRSPLAPAFIQAGEKMGYENRDPNSGNQTGFSFMQIMSRGGARCSTNKAFLQPAKLRPNLDILKNVQATKILVHNQTRRAYGVEYIDTFGSTQFIRARNEIIVCAGAINSPQLLMLSGIGPREHLEEMGIPLVQDLKGVGENLHDHISFGGLVFVLNDTVSFVESRMHDLSVYLKYYAEGSGPLTSPGAYEGVAYVYSKHSDKLVDQPDVELSLFASSIASDGDDLYSRGHGLSEEFYSQVYEPIALKDTFTLYPVLLHPKSRGNVQLQSSKPLSRPLINTNYLDNEDDVQILLEGIKIAAKLGQTRPFAPYNSKLHDVPFPACSEYSFRSDEYWMCAMRQYTVSMNRLGGTCKMGPRSDPTTVVDERLKVYGVKGLRVADASIMPEVISGHPTAAAIMIGEKVSDMIKEDWNVTLKEEAPRRKQPKTATTNDVYVDQTSPLPIPSLLRQSVPRFDPLLWPFNPRNVL